MYVMSIHNAGGQTDRSKGFEQTKLSQVGNGCRVSTSLVESIGNSQSEIEEKF